MFVPTAQLSRGNAMKGLPKRPVAPDHAVGVAVCALALVLAVSGVAAAGQGPPTSPQGRCQESLPDLFQRVSPSVVAISATSISLYDIDHRMDRVAGSGVIIDSSGLVLTNSHVVFGRQIITVTLDDGTSLPAELVGADPLFDIATIRIPTPSKGTLPVAHLGDSNHLAVGEQVFAIGNPYGLDQTLTRGIISAVNRMLPGGSLAFLEPLIQTDTAINPGSSGGPLIDACGDVIGITTALLEEARGIGFAIPSNLIKEVIPALQADGRVIRPWLGVQGQTVAPVLRQLLRMPLVEGFLVEVVEPGSPAAKLGIHGGELELNIGGQSVLLGGDIITEVNGAPVTDPEKLGRALDTLKVGTTVHLTLVRDGKNRQVQAVLTERPLLPWDMPAQRTVMPAATQRSGLSRPFGTVVRIF
jgi:serine protease Do